MPFAFAPPHTPARPIWFVTEETLASVLAALDPAARRFAQDTRFAGKAGQHALLPGPDGSLAAVLFGLEGAAARRRDPFLPGKLASALPSGAYRFANASPDGDAAELAALGFALSTYTFSRYLASPARAELVAPEGIDAARVERVAEAMFAARDLVNTPANDMGPGALEAAARALAARYGAECAVLRGAELVVGNFPLLHAVGRAAEEEPRLVDITWGDARAPKVTLVGKGVCFDTGGLDIKPSSAMLLMKKDMAGAATALAIAQMVMDARLPVRLRVLLPIVENAIAGNAFRPGDVYRSRKGLTVEIGNTDAEGRLILADALALADEEAPDLLLDFATLTGAARVALGPDLPPLYTMDDALARDLADLSASCADPIWRLPLWEPYDSLLDSKIATLNNIASGPFAGSIVAALFLRRFVERAQSWAHFDIYGWNPTTRPGRPEGGETQGARLVYALLQKRYKA